MSATEIADALTEALGFDNSKVVEGEPPVEHATDSSYPQVSEATVPSVLMPEQDFTISLITDFETTDQITGAVMQINEATKYIDIDAEVMSGTRMMLLTGQMTKNEDIPSKIFEAKIARKNSDGEVGNYYDLSFSTPPNEEDCNTACSKIEANGCNEELNIDTKEDCISGCIQYIPSKSCFDCILDNDDCTDMRQCAESECPSEYQQNTYDEPADQNTDGRTEQDSDSGEPAM